MSGEQLQTWNVCPRGRAKITCFFVRESNKWNVSPPDGRKQKTCLVKVQYNTAWNRTKSCAGRHQIQYGTEPIQHLGVRMHKSRHLIILSSSEEIYSAATGRHRMPTLWPQAATGRHRMSTLWPRILQISLNRCSRLHRQAKRQASKHPSIHSSGPRGRRQRR